LYHCTRTYANITWAPAATPATVTSNKSPYTASNTGGVTTPLPPGSSLASTGPTTTKKSMGSGLYTKKLGQKVFPSVFLVLALILVSTIGS